MRNKFLLSVYDPDEAGVLVMIPEDGVMRKVMLDIADQFGAVSISDNLMNIAIDDTCCESIIVRLPENIVHEAMRYIIGRKEISDCQEYGHNVARAKAAKARADYERRMSSVLRNDWGTPGSFSIRDKFAGIEV